MGYANGRSKEDWAVVHDAADKAFKEGVTREQFCKKIKASKSALFQSYVRCRGDNPWGNGMRSSQEIAKRKRSSRLEPKENGFIEYVRTDSQNGNSGNRTEVTKDGITLSVPAKEEFIRVAIAALRDA